MAYGILLQKNIQKSEHYIHCSKFRKKFQKRKKKVKNSYGFWKINKIIWNDKKRFVGQIFLPIFL